MFFPGFTVLYILYLWTSFVFMLANPFCINGAGTSPKLADCNAAMEQVPNNDTVVIVGRHSPEAYVAGRFVSGTCLIKVSQWAKAGMLWIKKEAQVEWKRVWEETGAAIANCSTMAGPDEITGTVILYPPYMEVRVVLVGSPGADGPTPGKDFFP